MGKQLFNFCLLFGLYFFGLANMGAQEPKEPQSNEKAQLTDKPSGIEKNLEHREGATDGKSDWRERARRILEISGTARTSAQQKADAYKELAALKPTHDEDSRLVYSFILAAMAEQQWTSAQKLAKEMIERRPDYVPARAAHARILLKIDQKLPAIAELEMLAKDLTSPSSVVSEEQLAAAASFLGLAVGYVEGPAKESVKPTSMKELIRATESLPQSLKDPFSQSRAAIGDEYRILVEDGEEALKELREGLAKDAEQMRSSLESKRAKTIEDADAEKRKLEESFAQSKKVWDAAMMQCQTLSNNAVNLQSQQAQLSQRLNSLRPPAVDKNGKVVDYNAERRYQNDQRQLETSILNLNNQLNNLSLQYDFISRKGMMAENQMNALRMQSKKLGMDFAAQSGSFAKMDRIVRSKEKSVQKAKPTLAGAKLSRARSFATYDDFNFHKERVLLIDSLPPQ